MAWCWHWLARSLFWYYDGSINRPYFATPESGIMAGGYSVEVHLTASDALAWVAKQPGLDRNRLAEGAMCKFGGNARDRTFSQATHKHRCWSDEYGVYVPCVQCRVPMRAEPGPVQLDVALNGDPLPNSPNLTPPGPYPCIASPFSALLPWLRVPWRP